jgi:ATP-dependent Zn protease
MMNELKCTAYHEAGHAVMAWFCEHRLRTSTIKPEGTNAGNIQHGEHAPPASLVDSHIWDDPTIALVDGALQKLTAIELQFDNFASEISDRFTANEKEVLIAAAGEVAQKKLEPKSFQPIHSSQDWGSVFESLEQLERGARERLYNATERLMDDPIVWAAVRALSAELLARETLSSSDAIAAMRRAIKHHLNQS